MWIAALSAMAAGACFAAANILQQHVASSRPESESLSMRLLGDLVRQRMWLAGIALAFLSYGFQSLALAFGPLSLVQAVIVSELVFAIPISARLHHISLGPRSWAGALAVAGGLAVAVAAASPGRGDPSATLWGWLAMVLAVAAVAGVAVVVGRRVSGVARASVFAFAGATVMGTQSALLAITIVNLEGGVVALLSAWQTYLLVAASVVGLLLMQSAFQEGPLAASLPVIDAVEPAVAITIGITLFGETLADGTLRRALAAVGALCVLAGIVLLDTSPAIQRLYRQEHGGAGRQPAEAAEPVRRRRQR